MGVNITPEMMVEDEQRWHTRDVITELGYCGNCMRERKDMTNLDIRFYAFIMRKAHEMLKAREPRVLDWNEIGTVDGAVWLEDRDENEVVPGLVMQMHSAVNLDIKKDGKLHTASASRSDYGERWRAWSAQPTEEQMRETPWEGEEDHEA